jgi:hypothetical protein
MNYLLHVLPCVDLPTHGICSFAHKLASELYKNSNCISGFANWYDPAPSETVTSFNKREMLSSLQKFKEEELTKCPYALLFHFDYGSYGWYDLPLWLPVFILFLKYKFSNLKFAIFVHEIYPITPRRFRERFLLKLSQRITWLFFNQADVLFCSNSTVEKILNSRKKNTQLCLYRPVFSNIGELQNPEMIFSKNPRDWVIFGSVDNLPKYIHSFRNQLEGFPEFLKPSHVTIIGGSNSDEVIHALNNLREKNIEVLYIPSASSEKCSEIFAKTKYCYIDYFNEKMAVNPELLLKSGVFAASNAHGVITVVPSSGFENFSSSSSHPGVIWKKGNTWQGLNEDSLCSKSILNWYHNHSSLQGMAELTASNL